MLPPTVNQVCSNAANLAGPIETMCDGRDLRAKTVGAALHLRRCEALVDPEQLPLMTIQIGETVPILECVDAARPRGADWQIGAHSDRARRRAWPVERFAQAVEVGMQTLKIDGMVKILMDLADNKMVRSVCIK